MDLGRGGRAAGQPGYGGMQPCNRVFLLTLRLLLVPPPAAPRSVAPWRRVAMPGGRAAVQRGRAAVQPCSGAAVQPEI